MGCDNCVSFSTLNGGTALGRYHYISIFLYKQILVKKSVFRRAGKYSSVYELYNVRKQHIDGITTRLCYVVGLFLCQKIYLSVGYHSPRLALSHTRFFYAWQESQSYRKQSWQAEQGYMHSCKILVGEDASIDANLREFICKKY